MDGSIYAIAGVYSWLLLVLVLHYIIKRYKEVMNELRRIEIMQQHILSGIEHLDRQREEVENNGVESKRKCRRRRRNLHEVRKNVGVISRYRT